MLDDHRLVDLWRLYSERRYYCCWIKESRREVTAFLSWSAQVDAVRRQITLAERDAARGVRPIHRRRHYIRAWGGRSLVEWRLA